MTHSRSQIGPLVCPKSIERFDRDMTVCVAADLPLGVLQAQLADAGQWVPIDGDPSLNVGPLVECNSSGPLRLGYGAWRDLLLGVQYENCRGQLITAGGRAMKNVAGYDLTKFMVGQVGAMGRIVTVTVRTYRRPTGALLATFPPEIRFINQLLPTALRPQWAILTATELQCGYLGDDRKLTWYGGALNALNDPQPLQVTRQTIDDDIRHRSALFRWPGGPDSFRASVPPTRVAEFAALSGVHHWAADAAHGILVGKAASASELLHCQAVACSMDGGIISAASLDLGAPNQPAGVNSILQRLTTGAAAPGVARGGSQGIV